MDTLTYPPDTALQTRAINAIRALTIDATEATGDGHPGMPMGAAAMGYTLWTRFLQHNPHNPSWFNRDRFVQSAGHGSMLLYSLLHLTGYDLPMAELKRYRQWGSQTPGHPEYGHTPGVETTTGPLGQGVSTAVGMALAEAHLAARFNRPGFDIIDHYTYVIASDGDLMEGVSAEASSLAGHLGLGKLIVLYDDNQITIDGKTEITFTEDVLKRYQAYGWHTERVEDGNDVAAIMAALERAKVDPRPSLIAVRTVIGYGSPNKAGSSAAHGSVLGAEEAKRTKDHLGLDWPAFSVPEDVLAHYQEAVTAGAAAEQRWQERLAAYQAAHPELAAELQRTMAGEVPEVHDLLPRFEVGGKDATRNSSHQVLNAIAGRVKELVGGSADLAGSNKTTLKGVAFMQRGHYAGRNIHFGVREHGMGAIANGLALHGGVIPYVATFLIFSDYLRPSLRLAALMGIKVIYLFTHDSIGLGGDGPTHQPIEHLMSLRAIPNLLLLRPADANETTQAWEVAVKQQGGPVVLALSRQDLPHLAIPQGAVVKGAYVLSESSGPLRLVLVATGSEVSLALAAQAALTQGGIGTRVVSMPSWELFDRQEAAYRDAVLPQGVPRLALEAGATLGWYKYLGATGSVIGVDRFGASAPGEEVMARYGFNVESVVQAAKQLLINC